MGYDLLDFKIIKVIALMDNYDQLSCKLFHYVDYSVAMTKICFFRYANTRHSNTWYCTHGNSHDYLFHKLVVIHV